MSNHSGSYMLNSLLTMIERESFFSDIGPEKTAEFIDHIRVLVLHHGECASCRDW